jgi:hypothetical protein
MMRIEKGGEAPEELDYSNAPTPEYSVEDLIKTVTTTRKMPIAAQVIAGALK